MSPASCAEAANVQLRFGASNVIVVSNAVSVVLVGSLLFLLVVVSRGLARRLVAVAQNVPAGAPLIAPVYFTLLQLMCALFLFEAITLFLPSGVFTSILLNLLLSLQCGIGDNFLLYMCFQNWRARGGQMDAYDSAFSRSALLRATVLSAASFIIYMAYLSIVSDRFKNCSWCSLFLPTPEIFWLYNAFAFVYMMVAILMGLQLVGWGDQLPPGLRPRVSMLPWCLFMLGIYATGNVGLGFVWFAGADPGYCVMLGSVVCYTVLYAPLLFLTLRRDTQYLWDKSRRENGDEAAALLARSYGDNFDILDSLLTDASLNRIRASDLQLNLRIGVGGCAEVWRAQWQGVDVAVKRLFAFSRKRERLALVEFVKECRVMSKLKHPHILSLLGVVLDSDDLEPSMVFEYMAGGNLFDKLHPAGRSAAQPVFDASWKLRLTRQCATAMAYLHASKIIHRDLKPANLLLDRTQEVLCVSDFGLSRVVSNSNTMTAAGTVHWCAPEVLSRSYYTTAADVYSFGIVLLETFSEQIPFEGREPMAIATAVIMNGERPHLSSVLPSSVTDIVKRCIDEEPQVRPAFTDLVQQLAGLEL